MKIFHIKISDLDKKYIRQLDPPKLPKKNKNLAGFIVNKPWGREHLMFNDDQVEIWHLFIKHLHSTSVHCHPNKKTSLVVLNGRALFSSINKSIELGPLDGVTIDAGTFHATQAISNDDLRVLEFETPPMKHDLLRLEDKYGRVASGYEGVGALVAADDSYLRLTGATDYSSEFYGNSFYLGKSLNKLTDFKKGKTNAIAVVLNGAVKVGKKEFSICDILKLDRTSLIKMSDDALVLSITESGE